MTEPKPWNRRAKPLPEPHLARLQKKMARGHSLEEAAEAVGLTLPLAKSVFIRAGLPVPKPHRHRVKDTTGPRIHAFLLQQDRATCRQVAEALGVSQAEVRRRIWDADLPRMVHQPPNRVRYSDAGILVGLQLMSFERGRREGATGRLPVSGAWWDAHRDRSVHPPAIEVVARFGSWSAACERAGIPARTRQRPMTADRRFTDEQLEQVVRSFLSDRPEGTAAAYEEWAAGQAALPSAATLQKRLGGWPVLRQRYGT